MSLRVEYKDGKLTLDVNDLLEGLTDEGRQDLMETLACQDNIINWVAEQIIGGYTPNGSAGSRSGYGTEPRSALDKARRLLAEQSSEIAKTEISSLKRYAEDQRSACDEWCKKYHAIKDRVSPIYH